MLRPHRQRDSEHEAVEDDQRGERRHHPGEESASVMSPHGAAGAFTGGMGRCREPSGTRNRR
jgi:hypothetical protein